jgi:hypothetical protein
MIPRAYALGQVVPPLRGWSEAILLALAEPEVDCLFLTNGAAELRSVDSRGGCPYVSLGGAKFCGICYLLGFLLVGFIKES